MRHEPAGFVVRQAHRGNRESGPAEAGIAVLWRLRFAATDQQSGAQRKQSLQAHAASVALVP
jgi:hypothetical protein